MNVLIADDRKDVRYGLGVLLEEQEKVNISGEAENFKELIQTILKRCPDMILLSWELPGQAGATLLKSIRLLCPGVIIVVMSSKPEVAQNALSIGADHFISKGEPPESLFRVIQSYHLMEQPGLIQSGGN